MDDQIQANEDLLAQASSSNEEKSDNGKAQSENKQLNSIRQKLMRHYQSQDKLAPFDDHEQSIGTCYIRLALLTQQQKDKMNNNWMMLLNFSWMDLFAKIFIYIVHFQFQKYGIITICDECAHALATISSQLGGKQLDNAIQCFIHRFPSYFYNNGFFTGATQFLMKLKEGQLDNVFQCLINRLCDEKENGYNRGRCAQLLEKFSMKWNDKQLDDEDANNRTKCAKLLGKLSMKWNEKQLNDSFDSLKDMLNEDDYWEYGKVLETITVKLSGKQFDN
ncbi:hypothetical protein RFI_03050, partial [Reticulomyxa filosa]